MCTHVFLIWLFINHLVAAEIPRIDTNKARIVVHASSAVGLPVKVTTADLVTQRPTVLAETKLDADGNVMLDVPLSKVLFLDVAVGNQQCELLLGPGGEVRINVIDKDNSNTVDYSGNGAQPANYLMKRKILWKKLEFKGGKHFMQLEPKAFANHVDSIRNLYKVFDQEFRKNTALSDPFVHLLTQKSKMHLLMYELNYALAHYNPYKHSDDDWLLLQKTAATFPVDEQALEANMFDYGYVLYSHLQAKVLFPLTKDMSGEELKMALPKLPLIADEKIQKIQYPSSIRTYLRAKNLYDFLFSQGITPEVDSLMTMLKKDAHYKHYEASIKPIYEKWASLRQGQPAPEFSGFVPTGELLSLSSLKGKVVYIDVWATWCAPCLEEFPEMKKLQQQFSDESRVAFLFLSRDRDQVAWKNFLKNDAELKGVHINQQPGDHYKSFQEAYQLGGIPRYILIDQKGNLVSVNAAHPSSGKVADEIKKLLK